MRALEESLSTRQENKDEVYAMLNDATGNIDIAETIRELEGEMVEAANNLQFEKAALLRDQVRELKRNLDGTATSKSERSSYGSPKRGGSRKRKGVQRS